MSEIKIRNMTIDDLPKIYRLGEKVFTLNKYPNLHRVWDENEVVEFFVNDKESCFVAVDEKNEIAGFILSYIIHKASIRYGYLVWLCIDKQYEKQGIASILFDKFLEHMKKNDVETVIVDVEKSNEKALNFFRNKGFSSPKEQIYLTLNLKDKK
ncbi:acetyltransferase, GNAT family [Deferribacter desulfuricans SSM1]|uniref:Acetyltransferase, GNAT family n=1 Tax=Deferribacter desulfuricans (strain DSM 14783 / JCM 11476 / NBRC 101012 / SSM1) TaxID=639282 RepID=D3PCC1_DEFDS|nr:N-acetyltransferase [Deferribacter desulfuricans]BAI80244.1 acetyltransferase, GNAT family [Deferribacter desulfuricans SSM1]